MNTLPKDCADYITRELGCDLKNVVAHRHVRGEEPKYAVLRRSGSAWGPHTSS